MSDAVTIALVTTLPTLLTVIGTQYMAWRKSKEHGVKLDAIEGIVNGNTGNLLNANHELIATNTALQERLDKIVPPAVRP